MSNFSQLRFAFFGTSHIAVYVLDALAKTGLLPALVVAPEDKPQGRGMRSASYAVTRWAKERGIPLAHGTMEFERGEWDVAVVVDYGALIPKHILSIPKRGFLNVHPSLLPRLRGPSPIRTAILQDEKRTGVSIMLVDEELDHGPIVAQKQCVILYWPPKNSDLERELMSAGGALLAQILPEWIAGGIEAREQNHDVATYTHKVKKEDALIDLKGDPYENLLKIRAYEGWPVAFTFFERNGKRIRVKITGAHLAGGPPTSLGAGKLAIDRVIPEGKSEMDYAEFLRSGAKPL